MSAIPTPVDLSSNFCAFKMETCHDQEKISTPGAARNTVKSYTMHGIYVKFDSVSGGEKALQAPNSRNFNQKKIMASYVVDKIYNSL